MERIQNLKSNVWVDGEKVTDVTTHRAFQGVIKSQASLYDLQHDPTIKDIMTFKSPTTGNRIGTSFLRPLTKEDLEKRRKMVQYWAKTSAGMMGRSPDYMNTNLMALAAANSLLDAQGSLFAENLANFYEHAREHDLSFTHTFVTPQVNRSELYYESEERIVAARIVEKNADGIVIKGARLLATQGGITDEIIVSSSGLKMFDEPFAYFFSIPSNTDGLKFLCREPFSYRSSTWDHPLGARFEEMDAIVTFDSVLVPWERVFVVENVEVANTLYTESSYKPLVLHQVVSRQVEKTAFILGLAQAIVDTIAIGEYQHVREKIVEIIAFYESMKSLLLASEIHASFDKWGTMVPDLNPLAAAITLYPKQYPRLVEIVQLLGASGLVSIPTEKDFCSPIKEDVKQYMQAATCDAATRVKLFRLAWDATMSAFGSRQTLYERFFFGDPVRFVHGTYREYDRKEFVDDIYKFLEK
ncbi:4-hydroxyphenylacetate 3-monooxygenase, oxygenase component [Sutcliffiella sp. NC1]|uniref:4-hydroxyphenylacetate 3-monooxygenase, oxygenase component n=1 Tax=Sutcliffiella sp. NC1 TaxID=3004096 RepID=UPI0022DE9231|nr:4-hydroxyphenylacetate 3-monooxygenase, oxygenase component [Sutcliffiella sp. NC1]WBL17478.1 4-hydroxyphenylacetate 3-monooxygenase, oxygenase component [Sutcliffiella sp. NC1]